jgi:hypothetical protein
MSEIEQLIKDYRWYYFQISEVLRLEFESTDQPPSRAVLDCWSKFYWTRDAHLKALDDLIKAFKKSGNNDKA